MQTQPSFGLERVLEFMRLMLKLQAVMRALGPPDRDYKENDVEHSYQLAMTAWYMNEADTMGLRLDRLLGYALVHDLAEAYAGDVTTLDHAGRVGKREREEAALERIAAEFPEFPALAAWVRRYDAGADAEAKFINALDKLMPMMLVYLDNGKAWHELGWSRSELFANKDETVAVSPEVTKLWHQLRAKLDEQPELFPRA